MWKDIFIGIFEMEDYFRFVRLPDSEIWIVRTDIKDTANFFRLSLHFVAAQSSSVGIHYGVASLSAFGNWRIYESNNYSTSKWTRVQNYKYSALQNYTDCNQNIGGHGEKTGRYEKGLILTVLETTWACFRE